MRFLITLFYIQLSAVVGAIDHIEAQLTTDQKPVNVDILDMIDSAPPIIGVNIEEKTWQDFRKAIEQIDWTTHYLKYGIRAAADFCKYVNMKGYLIKWMRIA